MIIMDSKEKILIWRAIMVWLIWIENGKSLDVHDGTVQTEREKTLIRGNLGILTCHFSGSPYAVIWKKGHDIWTSPTLVQWTPEEKTTGPRCDDGSCDMDENYSLIIKSVNHTDRGRFICLVSNEDGILVDNYTDVTVSDYALEMESSVTLRARQPGIVPCKLKIKPKRLSWVGSKNETLVFVDLLKDYIVRGGAGYQAELFNISDEYSLIIYNVKIQHQGLYVCVVTDHDTGIIYQNSTVLTIFAQPLKPFPLIEGCSSAEEYSNCIFTIDSPITITCKANEYYPYIGLYFKHETEEVKTVQMQTWNNTDGTKNKSISIVGHISQSIYSCIAFGIPGVDVNSSMSVRLIRESESSYKVTAAAISVPLALIATGLLTLTVFHKAGKINCRPTTKTTEDPVSYVELWKLVEFVSEHEEFSELNDVIEALCHYDVGTILDEMTKEYYYRELCKWKWKCATNIQKHTFYDKLYEKGLERSLADLKEFRGAVSTRVSLFDFEHILREIRDQENIIKFLESLGIHPPASMKKEKTSSPTFFQQALERLDKWTRLDRDTNPVVILSYALEKLNQKSANNFFLVPDAKKLTLEEKEIEQYTKKLSANHINKVFQITPLAVVKEVPVKNTDVLFNTKKMLCDWWNDQECSYCRRRCKLDIAVLSTQSCPASQQIKLTDWELQLIADSLNTNGKRQVCEHLGLSNISGSADGEEFYDSLCDWRHSNKGKVSIMNDELISALNLQYSMANDEWPSDDELKLISQYIDDEYTAHVRQHLELTNLTESANTNDLFDALCDWRQSVKQDVTAMYKKLLSALNDTNISGLLSPLRSDDVHRAEYVDITFNLLMTDMIPVAKLLGIHETNLSSYMPAFHSSRMDKRQTGLVSTLMPLLDKDKQREDLCRRLRECGFPSSIQRKIIAYQMSYGELSAIFTSMTTRKTIADEGKEAPQRDPQEGDHLLTEAEVQVVDKTTAPLQPKRTQAGEVTKGFSRIKNILRSNSSKQSPDTTQQEKEPKEADTFLGKSAAKTLNDTTIAMEPIAVQDVASSPEVTERATSSKETIVDMEPGAITSEVRLHLSEIRKTLNLSDEDVSSSMDDSPDEFTLFKIWKETTRFSAVSERAAVIKCLQDSGKNELARSVIEGRFIPEEVNLSFVKHIVKKAKTNSQLEELAEALGLEKEFQQSQGSVDDISEIIQIRLVISTKGSENIAGDGSGASKKLRVRKDVKSQMIHSRDHKLFNQADRLLEYGFLDLARELLIIYQQ